jgi:4-amino-4-deoxy-L-arabinose transferase-like glycosyltransferase
MKSNHGGEASSADVPSTAHWSGLRRRLSHGGRLHPSTSHLVPAMVYAAVLVLGVAFIVLDHHAPSWDQSHYLDVTFRYDSALLSGGVRSFLHQVQTLDPSRAPLFPVLMMPLTAVFGSSFRSGEWLNLLLWPILLYSVYGIASELFGRAAAVLAMVLAATMPLLVGLSHEVLQDFLVATLTTLTIYVMLRTHSFEHRGSSLAFGVLLMLDALAKVTAAVYVAAPLLVYLLWTAQPLIRELKSRTLRRHGLRRIGNLAMAAIIGAGGALVWYLPHLRPTLDYLALVTNGAIGTAPPDHGSLRSFIAFVVVFVLDVGATWLIVFAALVALVIVAPTKLRDVIRGYRPNLSVGLFRVLFLGAWIMTPLLLVGLSATQDVRYVASALPGVAIVVAGLLVSIRPAVLRRVVIGATSAIVVLQQMFIVLGLSALPLLPGTVSWSTGFGTATVDFSSRGILYDRPPEGPSGDYPTPIMRYLESRSHVDGHVVPRKIGFLAEEGFINGNTLGYLSDVRGDPFVFGDVPAQPSGSELARTLATYDFVLYVPGANTNQYIAFVNSHLAQSELTPAMEAAYPHAVTFPSAPGQVVVVLDRLP